MVKQSPELFEAEPEGPGDSHIAITLRDIAYSVDDDSIGMNVEGTYRGKKMSYSKICDSIYAVKY